MQDDDSDFTSSANENLTQTQDGYLIVLTQNYLYKIPRKGAAGSIARLPMSDKTHFWDLYSYINPRIIALSTFPGTDKLYIDMNRMKYIPAPNVSSDETSHDFLFFPHEIVARRKLNDGTTIMVTNAPEKDCRDNPQKSWEPGPTTSPSLTGFLYRYRSLKDPLQPFPLFARFNGAYINDQGVVLLHRRVGHACDSSEFVTYVDSKSGRTIGSPIDLAAGKDWYSRNPIEVWTLKDGSSILIDSQSKVYLVGSNGFVSKTTRLPFQQFYYELYELNGGKLFLHGWDRSNGGMHFQESTDIAFLTRDFRPLSTMHLKCPIEDLQVFSGNDIIGSQADNNWTCEDGLPLEKKGEDKFFTLKPIRISLAGQ